jgi:hypothetical protein
MAGIFEDLPGARTEAVPGPDGYSGCGLEKAKWTEPRVYIKGLNDGVLDYEVKGCKLPALQSRYMFRLEDDEIGELRSTKPLTDQDKLDIAVNLLKRVVL